MSDLRSGPLWLCIELPALPLEALSLPRAAPGEADRDGAHCVVYAQHGARRWVVAGNHPKIGTGEALGSVQARYPDLRVLPRDRAAEAAALQAIGCLAYTLSDRIVLIDDAPRGWFDRPFQAVAVDIAPSLKLFGGLDALLERAGALVRIAARSLADRERGLASTSTSEAINGLRFTRLKVAAGPAWAGA